MKQSCKKTSSSVRIKKVKSVQVAQPTVIETQMIALEKICLLKEHRLRVKDDAKTITRYTEVWAQYLGSKQADRSVQCPFGAVHVFRDRGVLPYGWLASLPGGSESRGYGNRLCRSSRQDDGNASRSGE